MNFTRYLRRGRNCGREARSHALKPHLPGDRPETVKFGRRPVFTHWEVLHRWSHVLTEGEPIALGIPQIGHRFEYLGFGFPVAQHQTGFCGNSWVILLDNTENVDRAIVLCPPPHLPATGAPSQYCGCNKPV